ncbi:MAG: hypothetical protein RMY28_026830 [Nostoc sp. ChiSLP01]|nr:hypothetical protein [Nostoc sp. CmiSLP01]
MKVNCCADFTTRRFFRRSLDLNCRMMSDRLLISLCRMQFAYSDGGDRAC